MGKQKHLVGKVGGKSLWEGLGEKAVGRFKFSQMF